MTNSYITSKVVRTVESISGLFLQHQTAAESHGYTDAIGVASWGGSPKNVELYALNLYDVSMLVADGVTLKPHEFVARYQTSATAAANMMPMIKVSLKYGRVYFLTDKANDGGIAEFVTQGTPCDYITMTTTSGLVG